MERKKYRPRESWPRRSYGKAGEKKGTTDKASAFDLCVAPTTQKCDWLINHSLICALISSCNRSLVITDALRECLSRFPKIESLKPEQKQAVDALLAGQDVLAILLTGFGKSLIYHVFCMGKLSSNANASVLVILPLNSIIEERVNELIWLMWCHSVTQQVTEEKA